MPSLQLLPLSDVYLATLLIKTVHLSVVKAPEAMTRTSRICYRKHFGTMTTAAQSAPERNSLRSLDTCDAALSRSIYRLCSVSAFAGYMLLIL